MATFDDLQTASKLRDLFVKIATKTISKERPLPRIGTVFSADRMTGTAEILFPGEADDNLVKVRFGENFAPARTVSSHDAGSADVVRVEGKPGSYYISGFVRGLPHYNVPVASMLEFAGPVTPTGFLRCDGSTYSTDQYPMLFSVIGSTYGGNGFSTFAVPTRPGTGGTSFIIKS